MRNRAALLDGSVRLGVDWPLIVVATIVGSPLVPAVTRAHPMTELDFHVLLALGDGPAHGYAIGKEIEERSAGRLDPTTGSLYQAIKRLTASGFIRHVSAPRGTEGDSRRKYFALTAAGRAATIAEIRRLESIVAVGRQRQLFRAGAR